MSTSPSISIFTYSFTAVYTTRLVDRCADRYFIMRGGRFLLLDDSSSVVLVLARDRDLRVPTVATDMVGEGMDVWTRWYMGGVDGWVLDVSFGGKGIN